MSEPRTDTRTSIDVLNELHEVRREKNAQYWLFTRTATAKPVDPALCRREVELEQELRNAMRAESEIAAHVTQTMREGY